MNRFEFGRLIASLRNDLDWTQMELSRKSGLDVSVISNIERGERKTILKDNIHLKLAEGFHLTSLEKMEFMLAAGSVTGNEKVRTKRGHPKVQFDAATFLKEAGGQIARIKLPVFITDSFCDALLANRCARNFHNIPPVMIQSAGATIGGYNLMRFIFDANSGFPAVIHNDDLERKALVNVRYFRRRTLRVRHKPYFAGLLKELLDNKKYPSFERCWRKALFEEFDDFSLPLETVREDDANSFLSTDTLYAITPFGEVYMHTLLPLNQKTADLMEKLSKKSGQGYDLFAAFPDEQKQ